jgi:hypothetical protein
VSCNTFFKKMAADTPTAIIEATLRAEGFVPSDRLTPEAAIGLVEGGDAVVARPEAILRAYARLVGTPWSEAEATRRVVLAGMRDSAASGTASGLARRGFWAKTGTVPALDGRWRWTTRVGQSWACWRRAQAMRPRTPWPSRWAGCVPGPVPEAAPCGSPKP